MASGNSGMRLTSCEKLQRAAVNFYHFKRCNYGLTFIIYLAFSCDFGHM